jgi:hypothetical protein
LPAGGFATCVELILHILVPANPARPQLLLASLYTLAILVFAATLCYAVVAPLETAHDSGVGVQAVWLQASYLRAAPAAHHHHI